MNIPADDASSLHPEQEATKAHLQDLPSEDFSPTELETPEAKPCCCLNCAKRSLLKPEHRCGSQDH